MKHFSCGSCFGVIGIWVRDFGAPEPCHGTTVVLRRYYYCPTTVFLMCCYCTTTVILPYYHCTSAVLLLCYYCSSILLLLLPTHSEAPSTGPARTNPTSFKRAYLPLQPPPRGPGPGYSAKECGSTLISQPRNSWRGEPTKHSTTFIPKT